jgi:hypothetical protein
MAQPVRSALRSSARDSHSNSISLSAPNDASAPIATLRSSNRANKTLHDTTLPPNASVVNDPKRKPPHSLPDRTSKRKHPSESELERKGTVAARKRRLDELGNRSVTLSNGVRSQAVLELKDFLRAPPSHNEETNGISAQGSTISEDTRSLRSKAGGSRLKSDLATYFPNFDDIISGVPQAPG